MLRLNLRIPEMVVPDAAVRSWQLLLGPGLRVPSTDRAQTRDPRALLSVSAPSVIWRLGLTNQPEIGYMPVTKMLYGTTFFLPALVNLDIQIMLKMAGIKLTMMLVR